MLAAMRATLLSAVSMIALSACSEIESARQPIVSGTPATDATVVAVIHTRPTGTRQLCSGTAIAADRVLTAKHCVFEDMGGAEWVALGPEVLSIALGDDATSPSAEVAVSSIDTTPGAYRDGAGAIGGDVAVLVTASALSVPSSPIATDPPAVSSAIRIVGFGYTEAGATGTLGRRYAGSTSIASVADGTFTSTTGSATCVGDSGGPAFDGAGAIVGVSSIGPRGCPDATSIFTRIDRHGDLLARHGIAPAEPDAGGADAGGVDAGSIAPSADAGGATTEAEGGGCAVAHGGDGLAVLLLVLALAWLRRRA